MKAMDTKGIIWGDTGIRSKGQAFIEGVNFCWIRNPSGKENHLIPVSVTWQYAGSKQGVLSAKGWGLL